MHKATFIELGIYNYAVYVLIETEALPSLVKWLVRRTLHLNFRHMPKCSKSRLYPCVMFLPTLLYKGSQEGMGVLSAMGMPGVALGNTITNASMWRKILLGLIVHLFFMSQSFFAQHQSAVLCRLMLLPSET